MFLDTDLVIFDDPYKCVLADYQAPCEPCQSRLLINPPLCRYILAVSYTTLTHPTNKRVECLVDASLVIKKTNKHRELDGTIREL